MKPLDLLALLPLFPMAVSIDDQEDKYAETNKAQNDNDRPLVPKVAHKLEEVRAHRFDPTYTLLAETEKVFV